VLAVVFSMIWHIASADIFVPTKYTKRDGIANTRHNLSMSRIAGNVIMDQVRNDYGEICVYCHTPHGTSKVLEAPLWNRTANGVVYTTYGQLNTATLQGNVMQPGVNSLTCLSCHDGTLAIDSIINMPGDGYYSVNQVITEDNSFLNAWPSGKAIPTTRHYRLNASNDSSSCLSCHDRGNGPSGDGATDFTVFAIGTDLRDDHPIGVRYPTNRLGTEFKIPTGVTESMSFFDTDGNQRADTYEVRMYDTGEGPEVECASCHDPHGVTPFNVPGKFNPSFLRVRNTGSKLCFTCHII